MITDSGQGDGTLHSCHTSRRELAASSLQATVTGSPLAQVGQQALALATGRFHVGFMGSRFGVEKGH